MICGIVSSNAIKSTSAPVKFRGVATLCSDNTIEVFKDDSGWPSVFTLVDLNANNVKLVDNDLMVGRSTSPFIRVYSWNGTTFVATGSFSTPPSGYSISTNSTPAISYDGNTINISALGGNVISMTRLKSGAYSNYKTFTMGLNASCMALNENGNLMFAGRGNNSSAGVSYLSGTTWGTFTGMSGSSPRGNFRPGAMSQSGNILYSAVITTSSPYILRYYHTLSTKTNTTLPAITTPPPSSWVVGSIDVSFDGTLLAIGYQAGTTANGGVRIYNQSSTTDYVAYDSGTMLSGRVSGVSFSSDGSTLYAAHATTGTSNNVRVWRKVGSSWTLSKILTTSAHFDQGTNLSNILISAN